MTSKRPATTQATTTATTIGQLRDSGYQVLPIREEMRNNLITKIRALPFALRLSKGDDGSARSW